MDTDQYQPEDDVTRRARLATQPQAQPASSPFQSDYDWLDAQQSSGRMPVPTGVKPAEVPQPKVAPVNDVAGPGDYLDLLKLHSLRTGSALLGKGAELAGQAMDDPAIQEGGRQLQGTYDTWAKQTAAGLTPGGQALEEGRGPWLQQQAATVTKMAPALAGMAVSTAAGTALGGPIGGTAAGPGSAALIFGTQKAKELGEQTAAMSPAQMEATPAYQKNISDGLNPYDAREKTIKDVGLEAFKNEALGQAVVAPLNYATGNLAGKFMPTSTLGKIAVNYLTSTADMAAFSTASKVGENVTRQSMLDPSVSVTDDLGEAAKEGALGAVPFAAMHAVKGHLADAPARREREAFRGELAQSIKDGTLTKLPDQDLDAAYQAASEIYKEHPKDKLIEASLLHMNAEQLARKRMPEDVGEQPAPPPPPAAPVFTNITDTLKAAGVADSPEWKEANDAVEAAQGKGQVEAAQQGLPVEVPNPEAFPASLRAADEMPAQAERDRLAEMLPPASGEGDISAAMDTLEAERKADPYSRENVEAAYQQRMDQAKAIADAKREEAARAVMQPELDLGEPVPVAPAPTATEIPAAPIYDPMARENEEALGDTQPQADMFTRPDLTPAEQAEVAQRQQQLQNLTNLLANERNQKAREQITATMQGVQDRLDSLTGVKEAVENPNTSAGELPTQQPIQGEDVYGLKQGDRIKDAEGNEYAFWDQRHGVMTIHPVVDGKPVINSESGIRVNIDDMAKTRNPDYRSDDFFPAQEKGATMASKIKNDETSVNIPSHEEDLWNQPLDIESKLEESEKKALDLYEARLVKQAKLDPPHDPIYTLVKGRLDPSSVSPEERKAINTKFGPGFWGKKGQRLHLDELEMEMKNNPLFGANVKENYGGDNLLTQLLHGVKSDRVMLKEHLDGISLERARLAEEIVREREQEGKPKSETGKTESAGQGDSGTAPADRRNGGARGEVDLNDFTDVPFRHSSPDESPAGLPAATVTDALKGTPFENVEVLHSPHDLPEGGLKAYILSKDPNAKGVYDPATGKAYVFSGNHGTVEDALNTAKGEISHRGTYVKAGDMAKQYGGDVEKAFNKLNAFHNEVLAVKGPEINAWLKENGYEKLVNTPRGANEWLAHEASKVVPKWYDRYVAAVAKFFRDAGKAIGFDFKMTYAEIRNWTREAMERGGMGEALIGENKNPMYQVGYHGSPHRGIEQFNWEKHKGTGEGNAAFGAGTYVTQTRGIGEQYRQDLSKNNASETAWPALRSALNEVDDIGFDSASQAANALLQDDWKGQYDLSPEEESRIEAALDAYKKARTGQLYEASIPEDDEMLNWDKPLSEQPEGVIEKIEPLVDLWISKKSPDDFEAAKERLMSSMTGSYFYNFDKLWEAADEAGALSFDGDKSVSQYLRSIGIPGHRYLDGMSRDKGDGSHNYVIYDDPRIDITGTFYRHGDQSVAGNTTPAPTPEAAKAAEDLKNKTPIGWAKHTLARVKDFGSQATEDPTAYPRDMMKRWEEAQWNAKNTGLSLTDEIQRAAGGKNTGALDTMPSKATPESKQLAAAISVYIDAKARPGVMYDFKKFAAENPDNPAVKEMMPIVEKALSLTPEEEAIADKANVILQDNGAKALKEGIIKTKLDSYVPHIPISKDGVAFDDGGSGGSGGKVGPQLFSKSQLDRTAPTFLDGVMRGIKYETLDIGRLVEKNMSDMGSIYATKKTIKEMMKVPYTDGGGILRTNGGEGFTKLDDRFYVWVPAGTVHAEIGENSLNGNTLDVKSFGKKFFLTPPEDAGMGASKTTAWEKQPIYAPDEVAVPINKMLAKDSVFDKVPALQALESANKEMKRSLLFFNAFHHISVTLGHLFTTPDLMTGLNPVASARKGNQWAITNNPAFEYLMKNGLTYGAGEDWNPEHKSLVEKGLRAAGLGKGADLMKAGETSLFNRYIPGLKAFNAVAELCRALKIDPEASAEQINEAMSKVKDPDSIAQAVARNINESFGGLNYQRMGRNPSLQRTSRLLFLASDWTESTFRQFFAAVAPNDLINKTIDKAIGGLPSPPGTSDVARKIWGRMALRAVSATIAANFLINSWTQKDRDEYLKMVKEGFSSVSQFRRLGWAGVRLNPIYEGLGSKIPNNEQRIFNFFGQYLDPMRMVTAPDLTISGKSSPTMKMMTNLMTGSDYAGRPFSNARTLLTTGQTVKANRFEPKEEFFDRIGSTLANSLIGTLPIGGSSVYKGATRETDPITAIGQAVGLRVSDLRPPPFKSEAARERQEIYDDFEHMYRSGKIDPEENAKIQKKVAAYKLKRSETIRENQLTKEDYPADIPAEFRNHIVTKVRKDQLKKAK